MKNRRTAEVCTCTVKCEAGNVNENCPLCEKSLRNCTAPETVKTDTETPQEKPKSNMGSLMILLVLALAGGGAALYYFKFRKPKADTTGHDDLDEYDFGEDEDADEEPAEIEALMIFPNNLSLIIKEPGLPIVEQTRFSFFKIVRIGIVPARIVQKNKISSFLCALPHKSCGN